MANSYEGLFTTPQDIRGNRLDKILEQQAATARMGGSLDALLGQVAAGGYNTGALMAEGTAGMFGLRTPEEMKAAEVQKMMATLQDTTDPNAYSAVAKRLNDMGYTREALAVLNQRGTMMQQRESEFGYQNKTRPMSVTVPDYKVVTDPLTGQQQLMRAGVKSHTFTQTYNHQTGQWEPSEAQAKAMYAQGTPPPSSDTTATPFDGRIKIGLTANPDPTNKDTPEPLDLSTLNPDVLWEDMMPAVRKRTQENYQIYLQTTSDVPPKTFKEYVVYDHIMTHGQPDTNITVFKQEDGRTERQQNRYQR